MTVAWITSPRGIQGNVWNNATVLAGAVSPVIDLQYTKQATVFGHIAATTNLIVQISEDGVNFYTTTNTALTANADFDIDFNMNARYVRFQSTKATTLTVTVAGK